VTTKFPATHLLHAHTALPVPKEMDDKDEKPIPIADLIALQLPPVNHAPVFRCKSSDYPVQYSLLIGKRDEYLSR
jgi:hypothetical protein